MFKWFLPHDVSFFDYFNKHAEVIQQAANEFHEMLLSGQNNEERAKRIKELEHAADTITHECIEKLHKTFITPFQRDDIHRLISKMDDIIDFIENGSTRLIIYKLSVATSDAQELSQILAKATKEVGNILAVLPSSERSKKIPSHFLEVHRLENEADRLHLKAIGKLFDDVQDVKLIIKWKEIYENLEDAIDCCEEVANIVEGVLLEST